MTHLRWDVPKMNTNTLMMGHRVHVYIFVTPDLLCFLYWLHKIYTPSDPLEM